MSETLVTCKDRTYTVQQKSCAERIAPIGTLSQNGYGTDAQALKGTATTSTASQVYRTEDFLLSIETTPAKGKDVRKHKPHWKQLRKTNREQERKELYQKGGRPCVSAHGWRAVVSL